MGNESLGPFNNSFESKFTTRNCKITLIFSRLILGPERLKSCILKAKQRNLRLRYIKIYKYIILKITCVLWSNLKIDKKNWSLKWQTPKNIYFNYVSTWITLKIYLLKGIRKPQLNRYSDKYVNVSAKAYLVVFDTHYRTLTTILV